MKNSFPVFVFLFVSKIVFAQTALFPPKAIVFDLGGSGGLYSLNYEKVFSKTLMKKHPLSFSRGASIFKEDNRFEMMFPFVLRTSFGTKTNQLIVGAGQGITISLRDGTSSPNFFARGILNIGLQHYNCEKRIFWRLIYTPLISYLVDIQYENWAGFSIGYILK